MNTINHIIGIAKVKINHQDDGITKQRPVRTVANTPQTSVARWFLTYPIEFYQDF